MKQLSPNALLDAGRRAFTIKAAFAGTALALAGRHASAQQRTIKLIVGYPAGGATDVLARVVADALRGPLGANVIVDNRAGAGGRVAAEIVKKAKPDGTTLLFTISSPMVIFPHIYQELRYDPIADFMPVGIAARSVLCLSVGPAVPDSVKTVADYVTWVKANPQLATFGTVSGSAPHFAGILFARAAGIDLRLTPYKGGAQAITDLAGGHLPATVTPVSEAQALRASGHIRTLATMGPQRPRAMADVPTMVELGYKEVSFQAWIGVFAPVGTPPAVVQQLNVALAGALKEPDVVTSVVKLGMEPSIVTTDEFAAVVRSDNELYRKSVALTGFKAED